ncbi:MAG: phosphotransferase [Chloroflexi bacterium]|nr:phosphotransferase [Chloroflexota bacterium]
MRYLERFVDDAIRPYVDRYGDVATRWYGRLMAAPQTLIHNDAHGANALFERRSGGAVAMIDWQGWQPGPGISDIARLITISLAPERRRAAEDALVADYVAALASRGIEYPLADALADYRIGSGWQWGWAVVFSRRAPLWSAGTRELMHVLVPRAIEALRDAGDGGLLSALEGRAGSA